MKNYLDYFIPKYQNAPGPLPEIEERNGIYYINGQVVGETPVSAKDPLLSLWVEGTALGKPLEIIGKGIGNFGGKILNKTSGLVKKFKNIKTPKRSDITDNFLRFADLNPSIKGMKLTDNTIYHLPNDEKLLVKELQSNGVDVYNLTREHLTEALNKRAKLLYETAPDKRHALIFPKQTSGRQVVVYDKPSEPYVGIMKTSVQEGGLEVPEIYQSYSQGTKVGRDLYDAALRSIQSEGGIGIRSADNLLDARPTLGTLKHYRDKQVIANSGVHRYMKTVNGEKVPDKVLVNQPVYKLTQPTNVNLPAKSVVFDPKIIDKNGVMYINWSDPNVLHSVIPTTFLWTGYNLNKKDNFQKANQ